MSTFEDVRRIALALPTVEEVVTWGSDLTFRVRGKIFAIGGEGAEIVSIKASPDAQADLLALDATTFSKAAYTGRFGWVNVRLAGVDEPMLEELLANAWRQTAPKRVVREADR
ncbi:MAG TPA: MmcQ/YjbR family DNA-binding protein [Candidatus Limnocylindrales bacterium]|nr:MmcQ/YjbR family DNA-binding protein [Candidatus Limnocylindrales bacterium]